MLEIGAEQGDELQVAKTIEMLLLFVVTCRWNFLAEA